MEFFPIYGNQMTKEGFGRLQWSTAEAGLRLWYESWNGERKGTFEEEVLRLAKLGGMSGGSMSFWLKTKKWRTGYESMNYEDWYKWKESLV